uniref:Sugar transporter SWEET n=1 Tax=Caenorhabditis japonica TaxID=281687 RepID=A0A8R1HNI3_CAEJA
MDLDMGTIAPSRLFAMYTSNLVWSLFLTSTALHAVALITSPVSALWLRYSIFLRDTKLILLQTYAVTMQLLFVVALIFYRTKRRKLIRLMSAISAGMFLLFLYIGNMNDEDGKEYKAVSSKCIDFVPLAPVVFTWVMELHAIVYSIGIDDFYMLLANTIFFCMDGSLLSMFFVYPTENKRDLKPSPIPTVM